ncbi:MAG: hypothetical protein HY925_02400, partial [Elusimicrobia bacterium]|nr:hypothetical protein [Elusimicrobiota bacterium]
MTFALLVAVAAALPPKGEFEAAYRAANGSIVNANLLMTSAQARVKRLQLAFEAAGAKSLNAKSRGAFDALSTRLGAFRAA